MWDLSYSPEKDKTHSEYTLGHRLLKCDQTLGNPSA